MCFDVDVDVEFHPISLRKNTRGLNFSAGFFFFFVFYLSIMEGKYIYVYLVGYHSLSYVRLAVETVVSAILTKTLPQWDIWDRQQSLTTIPPRGNRRGQGTGDGDRDRGQGQGQRDRGKGQGCGIVVGTSDMGLSLLRSVGELGPVAISLSGYSH
jgi:hypothetical protein